MEAAREKFRNTAVPAPFLSDNFALILLAPALKATRSCPAVDERDSMVDLDDRQVSALALSTVHDPPVLLQLDEPVFSSEVLPKQPSCRGRKSKKSVRFALDTPVKRRRFCFCC